MNETEIPYLKRLRSRNKLKKNQDGQREYELPLSERLASIKTKRNRNSWTKTVSHPDYNQPKVKKKKSEDSRKILIGNKNKENEVILSNPIKPVFLQNYSIFHFKNSNLKYPRKRKLKHSLCPQCGKLTNSLKQHNLLVHSESKAYKCDKCPKAFVSESRLQSHQRQVHGPRIIECDHCGAKFSSKVRLVSHMEYHFKEKTEVCNKCNQAFKRKAHLNRHMRYVHGAKAKSTVCEICSDTFHDAGSLRNHMRVHTRERPYNCEICSQPYSYKHDFNTHCLKKHGLWFKRRSVNVLNVEVLRQEKLLMRDLVLRLNGILQDDKPLNPFEGPQAPMVFKLMVEAIQTGKVLVDLNL